MIGPYRTSPERFPACPIEHCQACASAEASLELAHGRIDPEGLHRELHRIQRRRVHGERWSAESRRTLRRELREHLLGACTLVLPFVLLALFGFLLRSAAAQPPETSKRETDALVLAVAKVAANEASLATIRPAEVALIWQVTEARGDTTAERLAWLRAHSSCVLTDRPMSDRQAAGNCRWSRHLRADDTRPEGWPAHLSWERHAPRWAQVRELARRLVIGEETMRPCPSTPWTWGSRRLDMAQALARGLVPLDCRDPQTGSSTRNEGFAIASTLAPVSGTGLPRMISDRDGASSNGVEAPSRRAQGDR